MAVQGALAGTTASPNWLSPGALLTFPAASAAIKAAWEVLRLAVGSWGDSPWVPILMGVGIALVFFVSNFPEQPHRGAKIFGGLMLLPVNGLLLAGAALGLEGTLDEASEEAS